MPRCSSARSEERRVGKECRCRRAKDQAEDGIRDADVTGVQTCALPILIPEYKNISVEMETETTRLEGQLSAMQEELQKFELDFENNFESYSAVQREAKQQEYATMQQRKIGRASCRERV